MVRETVVFRTQEGQAEASVANILTDADLYRGGENPDSSTLIAECDTVDAHTALTRKP